MGAPPVRGKGRAHPTIAQRDEPSFSLIRADSRQRERRFVCPPGFCPLVRISASTRSRPRNSSKPSSREIRVRGRRCVGASEGTSSSLRRRHGIRCASGGVRACRCAARDRAGTRHRELAEIRAGDREAIRRRVTGACVEARGARRHRGRRRGARTADSRSRAAPESRGRRRRRGSMGSRRACRAATRGPSSRTITISTRGTNSRRSRANCATRRRRRRSSRRPWTPS